MTATPADRPTPEDLRGLLRGVVDPELGSDIVELGMVRSATIDADGAVLVTIALTTSGCPLRAQIQRDIRTRVGGGGVAAAGAALGLLGLPPVGAAVAVVGAVGAGTSWFRHRRRPHDLLDARRHDRDLARYRWEQVAGAGADPHAVEDLIHRYDPQHRVVAALVGESPAVRAADRVARERRMAWVAAWRAEVGDHAPVADPSLHDLLQRDRTELWLTPDPLRALDEPDTLVVAAPYADLPDDGPASSTSACSDSPRASG